MGKKKADRARAIERQPRPFAVRESLGAVHLHRYRIATSKNKSIVTLSFRHDNTELLDTESIDRALLPNPL